MEFRAVIKKSGDWWIGWLVDLPGVNAQERTSEKLIESLRIGAEDMLATPFKPEEKEELVSVKVEDKRRIHGLRGRLLIRHDNHRLHRL